jgi:hypothetical protein
LAGVFRCCGSVSAEGPLAAGARLKECSSGALKFRMVEIQNKQKKTTHNVWSDFRL